MAVRQALACALIVIASLGAGPGCKLFGMRSPLARHAPGGDPAAAPLPSPLSRELASHRPVPAPQPPLPPPLPGEPLVAPPRSDTFAGNLPPMPSNGPRNMVPPTPEVPDEIVAVSASLPAGATPVVAKPAARAVEPGVVEQAMPTPAKTENPGTNVHGSPGTSDLDTIKDRLAQAQARFAALTDVECRLVKREVVHGKELPTDEIVFRYRAKPAAVYMKVLSEAGKGREVLYLSSDPSVAHVISGKGDNAFVGTGFKSTFDPGSKLATSKSRYTIREAGFGRTIRGLAAAVEANRPGGLKWLGAVERPEAGYPLECVEVAIPPRGEPQLSAGGTRRIHFDPNPKSGGYRLPVLIVTTDAAGREVEYYSFDQIVSPANLPAEAWDPAKLGKR